MTITQFAVESGIPIKDLVTGKKGGCTNFQLLGHCKEDCTYEHAKIVIPDRRQKELSSALLRGLKVLEDKKKDILS